ncbi:FAD-dependent oxidoreductase [Sutterella sp.]|uniref:FAD-dependent oxidoreductase n=1 Tax=Sutterella sp. TaxID=1981025 RepID=UPI0026DEBD5D|nr:FAD-dependent oxidoreductase [Sutterella sp.]MDO5532619.1 FAD-dependent oxidoreductase [Sutterella sp.]
MTTTQFQRRSFLGLAIGSAGLAALPCTSHAAAAGSFDTTTDVLIIGAGMAGLTAGVLLARAGKKVTIVDKRAWAGGDGVLSTGTIFAAQTKYQREAGVTAGVSVEDYWKRLLAGLDDEPLTKVRDSLPLSPIYSGIAKHDPAVMRACVERSTSLVDFIESFGVEFRPVNPGRPFLHPTAPGSMNKLAAGLRDEILAKGGEIRMQTRATTLITDDKGTVTGAVLSAGGQETRAGARAVVLATGGFLDNEELMLRHKRFWAAAPRGFSYSDGDGGLPKDHTGDGIVMARSIGASLEDMEGVPKFWAATRKGTPGFAWMIFDTDSAYLVTRKGERIVNEAVARYTGCALKLLSVGEPEGYVLMDHRTVTGPNAARWRFDEVMKGGGLFRGDTPEEVAKAAGVDPEGLRATIERINRDAAAGADTAFGRTDSRFRALEAPYYLSAPYAPVMFKTEGGIEVNPKFEVLAHDDLAPIRGLYAIGSTCGSITTRLCDVFASGMIAAESISAKLG